MSESIFEQGLEENRNTNQLIYALAATTQRQEQLRLLEDQRKAQARHAQTEKARLEVERQRLALEVARVEAAKAEAEAVKELRRLLVRAGADLATIRRTANLPA